MLFSFLGKVQFTTGAFLLCLCLLLLTGCDRKEDEGVVARVNGEPIYIEQLKRAYGLRQFDYAMKNPDLKSIKKQYGDALTALIIEKCMAMALEKRKQEVTDAEAEAAEAKVRAWYTKDSFEAMLVEEYIGLESWREAVRGEVVTDKFFTVILRPKVNIDYEQVEQYYKEHAQDFALEARVRFQVVQGDKREVMEKVLAQRNSDKALPDVTNPSAVAQIRTLVASPHNLTKRWQDVLKGLDVGQASDIVATEYGYEALILLEHYPAETPALSALYDQMEAILLQEALHKAFDEWISTELAQAKIEITPGLYLTEDTSDSITDN